MKKQIFFNNIRTERRRMNKAKVIIIAAVLILVLIVILQNTESVETKFLFATMTMPRAFLLVLTFLFGFVAGLLVTLRVEGKIGKVHEEAEPEAE